MVLVLTLKIKELNCTLVVPSRVHPVLAVCIFYVVK